MRETFYKFIIYQEKIFRLVFDFSAATQCKIGIKQYLQFQGKKKIINYVIIQKDSEIINLFHKNYSRRHSIQVKNKLE